MSSNISNHDSALTPISVEQELWRIFTYYTLHADPTSPEKLKAAHFFRFAKDVQIVSPSNFTKADLGLELAKLVRGKRDVGDSALGHNVYFMDFVGILEHLAPMVYPERGADVALRRLLLENVFLLAGRRVPVDVTLPIPVDEAAEAMSLLRQRFGRSLLNIFNHYVDTATRRRAQEEVADRERVAAQLRRLAEQGRGQDALAQDKMRQHREAEKKLNFHLHHRSHPDSPAGTGAVTTTTATSCASSAARSHTIGHKEFFQFCQDFKLKSSALLSAIQVGEVYLTAAPLDGGDGDDAGGGMRAGENEADNGQQQKRRGGASDSGRSAADRILAAQRNRYMDFDRFLRSILLMSLLAYRGVHSRVLPVEKTKALLLYMWRAINSREKTEQAVNSRYGASKLVEGHAGSLNVHGSGMFSVTLQEMWKEDGFSSYVTKSDQRAGGNSWGTTSLSGSNTESTNTSTVTDSAGGMATSEGPAILDDEENIDAEGVYRASWRRSARLMQMGGGVNSNSASPVPSSTASPSGKATTKAKRRAPGSPSSAPSSSGHQGGQSSPGGNEVAEADPFGCAEILALSGLSTSLESMHLPATPTTPTPLRAASSSPWGKKAGPAALRGVELGELFRRRPELAEFMYLELLSSSSTTTGGI